MENSQRSRGIPEEQQWGTWKRGRRGSDRPRRVSRTTAELRFVGSHVDSVLDMWRVLRRGNVAAFYNPPNCGGGAQITKAGLYVRRRGFSCGQKLLLLLWRHKKFESWKLKLLSCLQLWLMLRSCMNQKHDLKKYRKMFLEKETMTFYFERVERVQSPKLNFFFFCLYLYRHKRENLEIEIFETVSNEPGGGAGQGPLVVSRHFKRYSKRWR